MSKNNSTGSIYCHRGQCFGTSYAFDFCIKSNSNADKISCSNLGSSYQHPSYPCGSNEAKSILAGTEIPNG